MVHEVPTLARRATLPLAVILLGAAGIAGIGTPSARAAATPHPAPSPVSAGYTHVLAVTSGGFVMAWGAGDNGALGVGTHTEHDNPVVVKGIGGAGYLSQVVAVAAGTRYSLALLANGTVAAWGDDTNGQLGIHSSGDERTNPVLVKGPGGTGTLSHIVAVASNPIGTTSMALRSDGTVWTWGENNANQLGDDSGHPNSQTPVEVVGPSGSGHLSGVVAVAAGAEHSVALRNDGSVWTWGGNSQDQLGDGLSGATASTPVQVVGVGNVGKLTQAVAISAGGYFTTALRADGTMLGWGDDQYGELGDFNTPTASNTPVAPVGLGGNIATIRTATYDTYAAKADGTVWGWGNNVVGSVGIGTTSPYIEGPTRVDRLVDGSGVTGLAGGYQAGFAVTAAGAVLGWGWNSVGQVGDGTTIDAHSPVRAFGLPQISNPPLFVLAAPKISGTPKAGHKLSVSKGTWGLPATAWAYQWLRNGHAISHATKSTYKLTKADQGKKVSVVVAASRPGYPAGQTTVKPVAVKKG
jgi:alpha-tubulin suppressor-like RCC1 family protein